MRKSLILALAAFAILLVTANAEAFDVKTGLWQIEATRETTGAMPIPPAMLNKMTPEQREHFQAAMQAHMNHPMLQSYKSCLTQKDLDEGFKPDRPECTSKVLSKSSSGEKVRMDCRSEMGTMSMLMNWHIVDREDATGTTETTMTGTDGRSMKSTGKMKAKWLSADCGGVQ
jgi:hypothetical protein